MALEPRLARLAEEIRSCRICRDSPTGKPMPVEPRPVVWPSSTARVLIAGQAPGLRVFESGLPFDDRSGDRLRDWLGVDRPTFYDERNFAIIPMGFCFPGYDAKGGDLPPRRECAPAWRGRLLGFMPQIDLVLAIGQYAQGWHLGDRRSASLAKTVANWRALVEASGGPQVLPLPHPSWRNTSWLNKNPWFETELLPWLRNAIALRLNPE